MRLRYALRDESRDSTPRYYHRCNIQVETTIEKCIQKTFVHSYLALRYSTSPAKFMNITHTRCTHCLGRTIAEPLRANTPRLTLRSWQPATSIPASQPRILTAKDDAHVFPNERAASEPSFRIMVPRDHESLGHCSRQDALASNGDSDDRPSYRSISVSKLCTNIALGLFHGKLSIWHA